MRDSIVAGLLLTASLVGTARAQPPAAPPPEGTLQVMLLGTGSGPSIRAERLGIATLVRAGSEQLLFDSGRSVTTGLARLGITAAGVTKVFLTHLHSDHVVGLPELWLFPWASQSRSTPISVWGPAGTRAMAEHLVQAFDFDIRIRRDVDEHYPAAGIQLLATDITEGVVYEANGVKVTAFLVDHAPIVPAFGYRIDYRGHSVVISGDTKPSENLVEHSQGVDVLIHELGLWKGDPRLQGPLDELMPGSRATRAQAVAIAGHHTDGVEAGEIFARTKPKLAVFSHYNVDPTATLPLVRQAYAGPVLFGEDSTTIDIASEVSVRPLRSTQ